jgi:hypothetical protein
MFHLPPQTDAHWVYDDPSGVAESAQPAQPAQPVELPKRGKIVRFPFPLPKPATPKAA